MRSLALLALALAVAAPFAGCLECRPSLDVRHCRPSSETCAPAAGDRVPDWNPELGAVFPEVARLVEGAPLGKHLHADWTAEQAAAFWAFWVVPADAADKQVFLRHEGELFRVRVLGCG